MKKGRKPGLVILFELAIPKTLCMTIVAKKCKYDKKQLIPAQSWLIGGNGSDITKSLNVKWHQYMYKYPVSAPSHPMKNTELPTTPLDGRVNWSHRNLIPCLLESSPTYHEPREIRRYIYNSPVGNMLKSERNLAPV